MSFNSALDCNVFLSSFLACFNSPILFDNKETEIGFPPKLEPEPYIMLSTPIKGPTNSDSREEIISARITSGRCSPGNKFIVRFALEAPLPNVLIVFTKSVLSVSFKYFSENSLFTIFALV